VLAHHGDPVGGVEDLQDPAFEVGVVGILEELLGARVLFTDPRQLLLFSSTGSGEVPPAGRAPVASPDADGWSASVVVIFPSKNIGAAVASHTEGKPAAGLPIRWMPWAYLEASGRQ